MQTIDLKEEEASLEDLLELAGTEAVLIRTISGHDFLLEEADELDRELAALGSSEGFMSFLEERSKEKGDIPLSKVARKRSM